MVSLGAREFLLAMAIISAVLCATDFPRFFQIENHEKKSEIDDSETPALPKADSYLIGVKRAFLPFRQLSKYLRRPSNDPRIIPVRTKLQNVVDVNSQRANRRRWERTDREDYPDIILIRPIDLIKLQAAKIDANEVQEPISIAKVRSLDDTRHEDNHRCSERKTPARAENQKNVNLDQKIIQANGLNIKLTFSVDVGNQSKAAENKGNCRGINLTKGKRQIMCS